MNFRNLNRHQRLAFGVGWLFLAHSLLNIAVGLYRCHDVIPGVTDHLATVFPIAQSSLLMCWLFFGPAQISRRVCGFVAGHFAIFMVYSNLLLPGFKSVRRQWKAVDWIIYFHGSGAPGDWLVKLPILFIGIGVPLFVFSSFYFFQKQSNPIECGEAEGEEIETSSKLKKWTVEMFQFTLIDLMFWIIALCLILVSLATPFHPGWSEKLMELLRESWKLDSAVNSLKFYTAILWVVSFLWILICTKIESMGSRMIIQIGFVIIFATVFDIYFQDFAPLRRLPSQVPLGVTFTLIVSCSLIVLEVLGDPKIDSMTAKVQPISIESPIVPAHEVTQVQIVTDEQINPT